MTIDDTQTTDQTPADAAVLIQPPPVVFKSKHDYDSFVVDELVQLHKELEKLAPVAGVSGFGIDMSRYRIDFATTATPEQMETAKAFLMDWQNYKKKQLTHKLNYDALDEWFQTQIAAGCPVSAGFTLGLADTDITLLTGNYILAQAAAGAGLTLPQIIDKDSVPHTVATIDDFTRIMLEYGGYRAELSKTYAEKKAKLDEALAAI